MNDAISRSTSLTAASDAGQKHGALESRYLPAGPLLWDCPLPAAAHHTEPHCKGTEAPQWRKWPKRCENALYCYLVAQEGHSFSLNLARAEVKQMEGPGTSEVTSSVQRGATAAA
jgi:hypothetical protein